jgi:hypothetical protein
LVLYKLLHKPHGMQNIKVSARNLTVTKARAV